MSAEEIERLRRRAGEERARAASFDDPELHNVHVELADKYDAVADAYLRLSRQP